MRESDLYAPVKRYLETCGYDVKAEVKGCDVVAQRPGAPPVIVELKVAFSLDLVLQGVMRQRMADDVYLAVPTPGTPAKRRNWSARRRAVLRLCRRLGLGLMLVDPDRDRIDRAVEVVLDPAPYAPRRDHKARRRLAQEFANRTGDPNVGGVTGQKIMTAYRQDALKCARHLAPGPLSLGQLRAETGIDRAASILQKNHYGWFERVARGVYGLTPAGRSALGP